MGRAPTPLPNASRGGLLAWTYNRVTIVRGKKNSRAHMSTVSFSPPSPSPTPCCCLPLTARGSVHVVIWGEGTGFPLHRLALTRRLRVAIPGARHLVVLGSAALKIFRTSTASPIRCAAINVLLCLTQFSLALILVLLVERYIKIGGPEASDHILAGRGKGCKAALAENTVFSTTFAEVPEGQGSELTNRRPLA